ncbi:MAG: AraC family transcriptional regulator, partial [Burkholderiales bacterium]|nr:AraC family transcriptional regulator [Burkholderiales bacterium]
MALIDAGLRGALVALLALVIVALLPHWRHSRHADLVRIGIALALSLAVQAVAASPWVEHELSCAVQSPGIGVSLGAAALFWLFARAVFEDGFRLRTWHGALWAAVVLYGATICLWSRWWPAFVLMRAVPIAFAVAGLAAVVGPWRVDLVEKRRRWRGLVVGGGAAYALVMVGLRIGSADGSLSGAAALGDAAMLLALTSVVAWQLLVPRA